MKQNNHFNQPLILIILLLFIACSTHAQKKAMTPEVYNIWNKIDGETLSNNGAYIAYTLNREAGDPTLKLYVKNTGSTFTFERAENPVFDYNGQFLLFRIKPFHDSVRQMKLDGIKKKDLPPDTLGIYNLTNQTLDKMANLKSFSLPDKWGDYATVKLVNKQSDKANDLIVIHLPTGESDTLVAVHNMVMPRENMGLVAYTEGIDSIQDAGLYSYNFNKNSFHNIFPFKGKFPQLAMSDDGQHLAFVADLDTTDAPIRPYELYAASGIELPALVISNSHNELPSGQQVSSFRGITWNEAGNKMYFGVSPVPLVEDTTKLEEEKPKVEIWTTNDDVLYTMQEVTKSRDSRQSYRISYDLDTKRIVALENTEVERIVIPEEQERNMFFGMDNQKYQKYITWLGHDYVDLYRVDAKTGNKSLVQEKINGRVLVSPGGEYAYWFDRDEQQYFSMNINSQVMVNFSNAIPHPLGDELNDRPMDAYPYGIAGWTTGDETLIIYDRYDIWEVDPRGIEEPIRWTNGRNQKTEYRIIDLEREEEYLQLSGAMLSIFDEKDKTSGYGRLQAPNQITILTKGPYRYTSRVRKAENAPVILYTKESQELFPDLYINNVDMTMEVKVSEANPHQSEYLWGSGKIIHWKNSSGEDMTGMLYTPDNMDPTKKYPMIVNFYERSSDGLYNHRAPFAGRSTISYSYYLSNGYVIFNPDVPYEIGAPGNSALEAVMTGVDAVLKEGYVDENRMALQGHSWGGYQIAHILTKTDRFACAESGAPVVNMTSAYGGIRWGSGMSRMFQYEKTQSRLGATLWEDPEVYLKNSPLFNVDKINTPVLILHNDKDGAVPWYQGIEFYMALRRLDKDGWLLNYNGEPHWPVKWPNRLDFQTRMEQFFNHYLKGAPMPAWMKEGVSELEKGKLLKY